MAKKKKTRQQKIQSDHRETPANPVSYTYSLNTPTPAANHGSIQTNTYSFVQKDLIHTLVVTTAVITGEVVLFFLLRSVI